MIDETRDKISFTPSNAKSTFTLLRFNVQVVWSAGNAIDIMLTHDHSSSFPYRIESLAIFICNTAYHCMHAVDNKYYYSPYSTALAIYKCKKTSSLKQSVTETRPTSRPQKGTSLPGATSSDVLCVKIRLGV